MGQRACLLLNEFAYFAIRHRARTFALTVKELAGRDLPAVVFCSAPQDCTGFLSALLQSALGAPDVTVIDDFVQTELRMPGEYSARARTWPQHAIAQSVLPPPFGSSDALMIAVLAEVRQRHKTSSRYLLDHGLPAADLERIKSRLVASSGE